MIPEHLLLPGLITILLFCPDYPHKNKTDPFVKSNINHHIIYSQIADSLPVQDSLTSIINLALNEKKISSIVNFRSKDSTIFNEIMIENVQYNNGEDILFSIRQYQPKIQHSVTLFFLVYHRKSKQFFVLDPLTEKQIPLDKWSTDL